MRGGGAAGRGGGVGATGGRETGGGAAGCTDSATGGAEAGCITCGVGGTGGRTGAGGGAGGATTGTFATAAAGRGTTVGTAGRGGAGGATGDLATGATGGTSAGGWASGGRTGAGGACCLRMALRTSPGREICERSILVLISSLPSRLGRAVLLAAGDSPAAARKCARTFSASCSSSELEWVFFSVTPTTGSTSRIALLLTSSSLARSLIRILLILLFAPPTLFR
jgi:hypothetical protein